MRIREPDDRVIGLGVATDQLVRLGYANHFLHARHFIERPRFHFSFIASDADGGTLRARHGVRPVSKRFDFLANGADLFFSSLRLHNYKHDQYPELSSLTFAEAKGNRGRSATFAASCI